MSDYGLKKFGFDATSYTTAMAVTNTTVYTPPTGKKIFVRAYRISSDTAMTVTLKLGTRTFELLYVGATGGIVVAAEEVLAYGAVDETVNITTSANGNVSVALAGYIA